MAGPRFNVVKDKSCVCKYCKQTFLARRTTAFICDKQACQSAARQEAAQRYKAKKAGL